MRCDAICVRADGCGPAALDNELVIEVEPGRFEDMVVTALDGLPEELGQVMRNVAVTVEHNPGRAHRDRARGEHPAAVHQPCRQVEPVRCELVAGIATG
jgi:hypothetical protein